MGKYFQLNSVTGVIDHVYHGNLKDYLMKVLNHPKHLIIISIQD